MFLRIVLWLCVAATSFGQSPYHNNNCDGNRKAIVHLFEWKWGDIANECTNILGPRGWCGVQVSPPMEHAVINGEVDGTQEPPQPWWQRYQPVSYTLDSRSGTEAEFAAMVQTCNEAGVRVYVDGVINHMTGMGRAGTGSGGSSFDADEGEFPGVPYTMADFNGCDTCPDCCCINNYADHDMVRDCRLVGLIDLKPSLPDVQDKIAEYMNRCTGYGVAGFRIDAAKHMWPADLEAIYGKLSDLPTEWFPAGSKPYIFMEVIDQNSNGEITIHEYTHIGQVTEFRFCSKVGSAAGSLWEIPGIYDPGWGMAAPEHAFTFVDNHDNQRGHGGGGNTVTHKDPMKYKVAQTIALGWEYGQPRVMSSYFFTDSELGPPSSGSPDYITKDVDCDENGAGGEFVCEHRWPVIAGMAGFAKAVNGEGAGNWWNDGNKAAWSRGNKGFVFISNDGPATETLTTGLPDGDYCNVAQGCATSSACEGDTITVSGGTASITITDGENPVVAIHVEAMAGSGQCVDGGGTAPTPGPTDEPTDKPTGVPTDETTPATGETTVATTTEGGPTTTRAPGEMQKTVIYMYMPTMPGQDGFIRGGIDHDQREGCTEDATTSACAIDIVHNSLGSDQHYEGYEAWAFGDSKLDWYGAEEGQGLFLGVEAVGTPMAWTTDDSTHPGYQPDNEWGEGYWKVDLNMDCSQALDEDGWFEVKAFVQNGNGWEMDIAQDVCGGSVGGTAPYTTLNHLARCGYFNVFRYSENECEINEF